MVMKMKNNNLILNIFTLVYLITHFVIYILLFGIRIFDSSKVHIFFYFVIISCFIYSFIFFLFRKNTHTLFIFLAFIFTGISDTFLVLLDDYYELALMTFIFTQLSYFIYIHITFFQEKKWLKDILVRILTIVIGLIVMIFVDKNSKLITFLSVVYFSNLLLNFIYSCCAKNKNFLFIMGLLLFIFCDFCVGCFNIGNIIEVSKDSIITKIKDYPINLSWVFYYPSQVLLSISNFKFTYKKMNN